MTGQGDGPTGASPRRVDPVRPEEALVGRLQALSAELAATPDEEFRAATRTRLVAMAAVRTPAAAGATRRPPRRTTRWRTRVTAGLTGAALTLAALGGLLALAQGARPGDLLYGLKRGGEQTQLALAGDDRGLTLLGFATTRLDELGQLVGVQPHAAPAAGTAPSGGGVLAAGPDVSLVVDTLRTMDAQTARGTAALTAAAVAHSDSDALAVLTGWADEQQAGIDRLSRAVPTGAEAALSASRDLAARVAGRGSDLEPALGCAGGPSTAGTDELGPRPAACPAAPGGPASPAAPSTAAGTTAAGTSAVSTSAVSTSAGGSATAAGTSAAGSTTAGTTAAGSTTAGTTAGGPAATGTAAPGTAAPAPGMSSAPTTAAPTSPPGLTLPSLPLPSLPGAPGPSTPPGPVVSAPPAVPGVSLCLPPLITVGC